MSTDIYAVIKRSSKYRNQQPRERGADVPFAVRFVDDVSYPVRGNDNNYRLDDLRFFARVADRFVQIG